MLDVERWAELRREHFVRGVSIKELARRHGIDRNTVRRALRAEEPPRYRRLPRASKLDPFKDEIHRLLQGDAKLPGVRVRELIEPLGFDGHKTIVDDYLREVRPLFRRARTYQRTVYRPGEICQFDLWEPSGPVSVGHGQTRRGWVVVACLGYSRAGAGALVFSKQAPDLLWGIGRCLWSLGGLPELLVWDREGALHAGEGRPTDVYAAFCGQLAVANARTHKTLRARPVDRLVEERRAMRPLPAREPDVDRRWVTRVAPDPYLRFDTNDYSLDPNLVGRRVEVRVSQREVVAVTLDTGELAARHERSFARQRAITALAHARALRERRGEPAPDVQVEQRPLARYDRLIA
ncbi:MAG: hypothetical protein LC790_03340 [Actinobacteria bacterium]|nr:hypothetical protein [Actinomycetota bacterium]